MARLFVASSGSNTSPYDTWAKAATSLQTALTAAAAGDEVILGVTAIPSADAETAASTTWTLTAGTSLICSTISGTDTVTPTVMGTTYWIGTSTATRNAQLAGTGYVYGLTTRAHNSGSVRWSVNDDDSQELVNCRAWQSSTNSNATIFIGNGLNSFVRTRGCVMQIDRDGGSTSVLHRGRVIHRGLSFVIGGSSWGGNAFAQAGENGILELTVYDSDLTGIPTGKTLINAAARGSSTWRFVGCQMPADYTLHENLAAVPSEAGDRVYLVRCKKGTTQIPYEFHNALGALVLDGTIKMTGEANSWKIVTTTLCNRSRPFVTPWVAWRNPPTTSVTPRFEVLRDGSATAYTDEQIGAQFSANTTADSPVGAVFTDLVAPGNTGSAQAAGAGLGAWDGESGTAWSGKIDSGAALTPVDGYPLSGRAFVAMPSATVYVDPTIRT